MKSKETAAAMGGAVLLLLRLLGKECEGKWNM